MCEKLHFNLLDSFKYNSSLGLAHGKMGICIYFFILSRLDNKNEYQKIAEQILYEINNELSLDLNIDIENGLAGIALGIRYLILKGYETGDINDILEDIDNIIYKRLSNISISTTPIINDFTNIQLLYYLFVRLKDLDENSDNTFLFKELIIKLINLLGNSEISNIFFKEATSYSLYYYHLPLLFYVFNNILKLNIHNQKIDMLLSSTINKALSHHPLLHSNKIYLLWGALSIRNYINSKTWDNYILDLKERIDINHLINNELKNQDIFFSNGIVSIYALLEMINTMQSFVNIHFDKDKFRQMIMGSKAWESLYEKPSFFKIHKGLFNGFPSSILALHFIN